MSGKRDVAYRQRFPKAAGGFHIGRTSQLRNQNLPKGRPAIRRAEEWTKWPELRVKIIGMPADITTFDVYETFVEKGQISQIDLLEDPAGNRTGDAFVTFSPPPGRAFWDTAEGLNVQMHDGTTCVFQIQLQPKLRTFMHTSPVNPQVQYPERMILQLTQIEFGYRHSESQMMVMHTVHGTASGSIDLTLNLLRREMVIEFSIFISRPETENVFDADRVKFQVPIHQMDTFSESFTSSTHVALSFSLNHAPNFYRKFHGLQPTFGDDRHWNERFRWARMTNIRLRDASNVKLCQNEPLQLRQAEDTINIGRWTTYRVSFKRNNSSMQTYQQFRRALQDYNVKFFDNPEIEVTKPGENDIVIWDLIDNHKSTSLNLSLDEMLRKDVFDLSWPLRYQLESCISLNIISERSITKDFLSDLTSMPERIAISKLEAAADASRTFYDPLEILRLSIPRATLLSHVPNHCIVQRSVIVTPTTVYFKPPIVEMSNRILRHYQEHADRFIRVRFTEEKSEGRLQPRDDDTHDAVYTRIYNCLTNGIVIGNRHFEFLAMGNSQFREHGAYFFASTMDISASQIREKMGKIGKFRDGEFLPEMIVAKYASRLGQCFSTTRPIRGTTLKMIEAQDVIRNGFNFTDGVGMISLFVARLISLELGLPSQVSTVPSVFQFRMGGTKGILAVSPQVKDNQVHIRESQYKFAAVYEGLDIIRWSYYSMPRLNRQLITVLSSLGIREGIFLDKLTEELERLDLAMTDEAVAQSILRQHIDYNQMTLAVANIMADGFMQVQDPFALSILGLWRAWTTKQLKEKASLAVSQGAFLLGCTDETTTLKGYFWNAMPGADAPLQEKINALPQIFLQVSDPDVPGKYRIIKDRVCIVARNPSLHSGDIRVVQAVDVSALHHLRDVIVFPQTGDRDIPSMCSGGDLDGDDFIVIWDEKLIPPESQWDNPAMDFTAPVPERKEQGEVDAQDIIKFFITYMKTDTLRTIANSHLANADSLPDGIRNWKCLELARLHSIAVDYPKSGIPAHPTRKLRPYLWPHFMRSRYRRKEQYYHSTTVLGQLYDVVAPVNFQPIISYAFDERIIGAFQLDDATLEAASAIKKEYDSAMRRIMAQQEIATEFEVWTTFVLDHARLSNDYKFHEEIGQLSANLKNQFIRICQARAGGKDYPTLAPFVAAMYVVTAQELEAALAQMNAPSGEVEMGLEPLPDCDVTELPLISFPWLFPSELGKIARGPRAAIPRKTKRVTNQTQQQKISKNPSDLIDLTEHGDEIMIGSEVTCRGDILELFQGMDENAKEGDVNLAKYKKTSDIWVAREDVEMSFDGTCGEEMEEGEILEE